MLEDLQFKLKTSSASLALMIYRAVSGLVLGVTISLVVDEILQSGSLVFVIVTAVTLAAYWRISRPWQWLGVTISNLTFVLIGLLLRMYILVAPGG
jgi:hypothetical protein